MKLLTLIYWLRMALGIMSGAVCAFFSNFLVGNGVDGTNVLLLSISLTLLIYMVTLNLLKRKYQNQVENPSKIAMTGIGMYFVAWIAFYTLFYTIIYVATGNVLAYPAVG
ncbi:MAG: hypothetical protein FWH37_05260 [Candidatus Bathyarchaeota archaeon]|nr:hypothetical protein [Candidatus Termiticorpusculum sp.]